MDNDIRENALAVYQKTLMYWANSASYVDFDALAKSDHIANRVTPEKLSSFLPRPTHETRQDWLQRDLKRQVKLDATANPVAMLIALSDVNSPLGRQAVLGIPLAHDDQMQFFVPISTGQAPMINPRFLCRPQDLANEHRVYIGDEEIYQDFIDREDIIQTHNWAEYWRYVMKMMRALTGVDGPTEALQHTLGVDFHWAIVPWAVDFHGKSLSKQYDKLRDHDIAPPLFRRIAMSEEPAPIVFHDRLAIQGLDQILGHMDTYNEQQHCRESFALDDSQRRAASAMTQIEEGELLAVNGPPGTGKTSFLRSVVATTWVQAAIDGKQAPIIVATGSTNKAVTNVIGAFACVAGPQGQAAWQSRWISHAPSYGWYYPSITKMEEASAGSFMLLVDSQPFNDEGDQFILEGTAQRLRLKDEALKHAVCMYLERHAAVCGLSHSLPSISDAKSHIRALLIDSVASMRSIQARYTLWVQGPESWKGPNTWHAEGRELLAHLMGEGFPATAVEVWKTQAISQPSVQLQTVQAHLDRAYRFKHFHMAARYWEARWLEHCLMHQHGESLDRIEELRALAMVAPVFVSTTHRMHKLIKQHGGADLLIFDEAGQTSVEAGAAMFAFAKKAIVVGDVYQLKPVYKVNPARSRDMKRQAGIHTLPVHFDVARSSVMALAQAASRWTEFGLDSGKPLGLNLRNHYRCQPAIIGYCQSLIYKGNLQACRAQSSTAPLPAMSWVEVPDHIGARQEGGTRLNLDEVDQICTWLEQEGEPLMRHYGKDSLAEVVAVIAPFRGQVEQIQMAIAERLPASWTRGMIVNTVHSLQGAELPVVAFSVTQTEAPFFVDRHGPNLLNVAVSRAKDSFIAFASKQLWQDMFAEQEQGSPMQSLASYMRQHGRRLYPRDLYLIEAPGKVDTMRKAIGLQAHVVATGGHFKKLLVNEGGLSFQKVGDGVDQVLHDLAEDHGQIDRIFLATDDDDDGEEIAWHLLQELSAIDTGTGFGEKIKRIRFHSVTHDALACAVDNAESHINLDRVRANVAKKVVDFTLHEQMRASHVQATRPQWLLMQEVARRQQVLPKWHIQWRAQLHGEEVVGVVNNTVGAPLQLPTRQRFDATVRRLREHVAASTFFARSKIQRRKGRPTTTASVLARAYQKHRWQPHYTMAKLRVLYEGHRRLRVVGAAAPGHIQALPHGGVISYPRTEGTTLALTVGIAAAALDTPSFATAQQGVA